MAWDRLLDIIRKAQQKHPAFGRRLVEAEAVGRWEMAVGPQIAKHTSAVRVEDGVLWVEVDHPIWKSELHHRKHQILQILNEGRPEATPEVSEGPSTEPLRRLGAPPVPKGPQALAPARQILKDLFFIDPRKKPRY